TASSWRNSADVSGTGISSRSARGGGGSQQCRNVGGKASGSLSLPDFGEGGRAKARPGGVLQVQLDRKKTPPWPSPTSARSRGGKARGATAISRPPAGYRPCSRLAPRTCRRRRRY